MNDIYIHHYPSNVTFFLSSFFRLRTLSSSEVARNLMHLVHHHRQQRPRVLHCQLLDVPPSILVVQVRQQAGLQEAHGFLRGLGHTQVSDARRQHAPQRAEEERGVSPENEEGASKVRLEALEVSGLLPTHRGQHFSRESQFRPENNHTSNLRDGTTHRH